MSATAREPSTALVTGAGGFLGRYLVEKLLARGDRVRGFARGSYPDLEALGAEMIRGDIRDQTAVTAACEGVDVVYHAAARPGIWGPWKEFYEVNTLGTEHVVEGCLQHGAARLVYTSSPSVTFDGTDQEGVDETEPYPDQWLCHYPHTKALGEQHVLKQNGRQHERGQLFTCALRPHLIWGPRDNHLIPRLIKRAQAGRLRRVGDGKNLVDMIYVENAADAHLQAADGLIPGSPVCGQAYFLSQGEPVLCWKWINDILALAGVEPVRKSLSATAAYRLGAVCEAVWTLGRFRGEPPMTRFLAAQLSTHHWFNIRKAEADFGYAPQISTAEGMRRMGEELQTGKAGVSA